VVKISELQVILASYYKLPHISNCCITQKCIYIYVDRADPMSKITKSMYGISLNVSPFSCPLGPAYAQH